MPNNIIFYPAPSLTFKLENQVLYSLKLLNKTICFSALIFLLSCSGAGKKVTETEFDNQASLSKGDFKKLLIKDKNNNDKATSEKAFKDAPIPALSKLIISPPPPVIGGEKTISFSVTDQVPLKDVLIELGRVAKIDIDLDPKISGGIIINAKNRPLKEVIDRIATLGNLRYSYKNGVLHFESDTPFIKNYFVDYLFDGKLWGDVETNITAILTTTTAPAPSSLLADIAPSSSSATSSFSSNKSAGIISILATEKQHALVVQYLADVEKSASAQVIIEAKLVEVVLKKEFRAGINWELIGSKDTVNLSGGFAASTTTSETTIVNPLNLAFKGIFGSNLNASISALEQFGTTRTLSSPRIHAINNQKAVLSFADRLVYFKVEQTQSSTAATGVSGTTVIAQAITSTKLEEKQGVELEIIPSINVKTKEITLNIKPKITIKTKDVTDPANILNLIPVMQSRELNTTAKIQSGNALVIGGLMKESTSNSDTGVPFLANIPVLGWLFKFQSKSSEIIETVIFIKATVVSSGSNASKHDRELQNKLDSTPKPFFQ